MNYICKICNNEFTHKSFCYHITHNHNISIAEYYDKYIQKGICSTCGKQHKEMKNLSIRHFKCECEYSNDRDVNAALNIKREGLRLLTVI